MASFEDILAGIGGGVSSGIGTFLDLKRQQDREALERALLETQLANEEDRGREAAFEASRRARREERAGRDVARDARRAARSERRQAEQALGQQEQAQTGARERARFIAGQFPEQFQGVNIDTADPAVLEEIVRQGADLSRQRAQLEFAPPPKPATPRQAPPESLRIEEIATNLLRNGNAASVAEARLMAEELVRGQRGGIDVSPDGLSGVTEIPRSIQQVAGRLAENPDLRVEDLVNLDAMSPEQRQEFERLLDLARR